METGERKEPKFTSNFWHLTGILENNCLRFLCLPIELETSVLIFWTFGGRWAVLTAEHFYRPSSCLVNFGRSTDLLSPAIFFVSSVPGGWSLWWHKVLKHFVGLPRMLQVFTPLSVNSSYTVPSPVLLWVWWRNLWITVLSVQSSMCLRVFWCFV